jgi:Asp-tRNA(Asn)/Glu-tRNA(Gln) amidotransferase A subunit family amidase
MDANAARELTHLSIAEAGRMLLAHDVSPVDLVEAFLHRIAAIDGTIKSYLLVDAEGARAKAKRAEAEIMAGRWRGMLHGIPFGAKDNYYTKGLRTTANSRVLIDHVPDFDAAVIERLDAAGAILLGKLNTWEYGTGLGAVFHDAAFEQARNPWKDNYFTGGSSTGSGAAVAAGTAMFALGSDTGGSVRAPAAACGVQGMKPTYGRISRYGILPNSWSLDVPGTLTWTIEDCAIVMQAICGHDPRDGATGTADVPNFLDHGNRGVSGLRMAVVRELGRGFAPDPAVKAGLDDVASVFADAGAELVEVHLPAPLPDYRDVTILISSSERATVHERDFIAHAELMGRELRESIMAGSAARAVDYIAAQRRRRELALATDALICGFDVLLLPCACHAAPSFDDPKAVLAFMSDAATTPFSLSGHPALAMRTGFDEAGLPIGAQLVGRYFDEATVLRAARAYERARTWHRRRPRS